MGIYSVKIENFKSIRDSGEILMNPLNVLIGPNGAGKSNFISFFKLLNKISNGQLQIYINENGRSENFLYFGNKSSKFLFGRITFDNEKKNEYEFRFIPNVEGNFIFEEEWSNYYEGNIKNRDKLNRSYTGRFESLLKEHRGFRNHYLRNHFNSFKIFHFQDTSITSRMRKPSNTNDYAYLYEDGGNIASFLYMLQESKPEYFNIIEKITQSVAPFFERFYLKPDEINPQQIFLRWNEKGSDQLFNAYNLSDGTLRMICLTILLNQPEPPSTIIIDEPELGLHPFAIIKLASMIRSAISRTQIIVSTQSVSLLDQFSPEDVIVVEREDYQTVFKRQNSQTLSIWLDDYTLGEIWDKNLIGGRP